MRFLRFNEYSINESAFVVSDNLKLILRNIDSPVSNSIKSIIGNDFNLTNNYLDLSDNKNQITFISDRRAQEIITGKAGKLVKVTGTGYLRHSDANSEIFKILGYTPEGGETYKPSQDETGEIISEQVSPKSGNTYVVIQFPGGKTVINKNSVTPIDVSIIPFKKYRQPGRIGATIKTILNQAGIKHKDSEIEEFVNKYKSEFDKFNDGFAGFELVSGSDIHHWYQYRNYLKGRDKGQLSNSCMARASEDMLSIYTSNPSVCRLLILKDREHPDKIKGRALVWNLTTPESAIYVDRIYTHDDSDLELFKKYIAIQGWYLKYHYTSSTSDTSVITPEGEKKILRSLSVNLKPIEYDAYPYLDTLKYYTPSTGELNSYSGDYLLEDTGGGWSNSGCDYCGDSGHVECGECNGSGREECGRCDGYGEEICKRCNETGYETCDLCDGSGEIDDGDGPVECGNCDGKGKVECDDCSGSGKRECSRCDGDGEVSCHNCDGDGEVSCPECS